MLHIWSLARYSQFRRSAFQARRSALAFRRFAARAIWRPSRFAFGVVPFLAQSFAWTSSCSAHRDDFSACLRVLLTT